MQKINIDQVKELDNSIANLFDIKTNSEPMTQKGWCCISDSQPKRLAKADVPTAYNFLKDKLDNADSEIGGWQTNTVNNYIKVFIVDNINALIFSGNNKLYKSSISDIGDNTKWVEVSLSINYSFALNTPYGLTLKIINNLVIFMVSNNTTYNNSIVILDKNTLQEIKILNANHYENTPYINYVNGYIYFTCKYYTYRFLYSENPNDINLELVKTINDDYLKIINIFKYENGYFYLCFLYRDDNWRYRICKTTDIANGEMITIKENINGTSGSPLIHNDNNGNLIYTYNNGTILISKNMNNWDNSGNWDKSDDWDSISIDFTNYGSEYTSSSAIYNYYINPNYCILTYQLTDKNIVLYTKDLKTFYLLGDLSGYAILNADTNGQFGVYNWIYNNPQSIYKYSLPYIVPTVYTDTINGIDINYYKSGDLKICTPDIAVGNDDNLQAIYEYLGYLNYWWIDTTEEKITLQRNSNMWTMMYVGDDYEDDELPVGSFEGVATKEELRELLPDQTNNDGKFLTTNGSTVSWAEVQGGGSFATLDFFEGITGTTLNTNLDLGNSVLLFKNGVGPLKEGLSADFTISGSTITFLTPLVANDRIGVINGNISSIDLTKYTLKPEVLIDQVTTNMVLQANTIYKWTNPISTLTISSIEISDYETRLYFITDNTITFTDNSNLKWGGDGSAPSSLEINTRYCIVICNGLAEIDTFGTVS